MIAALCLAVVAPAMAQVSVSPAPDQLDLLADPDPQLARNKRIAFDFWREVLEAGHLDRVETYLTPGYIQHNPVTPTGRSGFLEHFRGRLPERPISSLIAKKVVAIVAERNLVIISTVREMNGEQVGGPYTTTYFDMFRIEDGKIAEHWDAGTKIAM